MLSAALQFNALLKNIEMTKNNYIKVNIDIEQYIQNGCKDFKQLTLVPSGIEDKYIYPCGRKKIENLCEKAKEIAEKNKSILIAYWPVKRTNYLFQKKHNSWANDSCVEKGKSAIFCKKYYKKQ